MAKIVKVGSAPAEPIPVAPGETVGVLVKYRNMGVLPGIFLWRLQMDPRTWLHGWNAGTEAEWVTQEVAAGAEAEVTILRAIPANWGAGDIFAKVDCRTDTIGFMDKEVDPNPCWTITPASPAWIEIIDTTYFVR